MRRVLSAVLMLPLLLLLGCGRSNSEDQTALDLRAALTQSGGCRFVSAVHADWDGRLYDFTLQYESGDQSTVCVLQPERVAGVQARVNAEDAALEFEDVSLTFGLGNEAIATPLMLPHLLRECLADAYIAYTASTDAGTAVRYYYGYGAERLEVEVILDRASLTPLSCEVFLNGAVILSAEISDFALVELT